MAASDPLTRLPPNPHESPQQITWRRIARRGVRVGGKPGVAWATVCATCRSRLWVDPPP
jgi:hypothetical protein